MDFLVNLNTALDGHLVWILPLILCGLVHAINWNCSYKSYVIKGKHRNDKDSFQQDTQMKTRKRE